MAAAEIFVYYRIAASDEATVCRQVALFQRALGDRFAGLQARLLRRCDDGEEGPTLMETYAWAGGDDGASQVELLAAIEQAAGVIAPSVIGGRHVEVFEPCV